MVCGYDLPPGPDYSCEGDVLVATMNCPPAGTEPTTRKDCTASGQRCFAPDRQTGSCVSICTSAIQLPPFGSPVAEPPASDCPADNFCSPTRYNAGAFICQAYAHAGQLCGEGSVCQPGLSCVSPAADAGDGGAGRDAGDGAAPASVSPYPSCQAS